MVQVGIGIWLRLGTAALYFLFGAYVLLVRPRRHPKAWLGLFLVFFGASLVARNIADAFGGRAPPAPEAPHFNWGTHLPAALLYAAAGIAGLGAAIRFPRRLSGAEAAGWRIAAGLFGLLLLGRLALDAANMDEILASQNAVLGMPVWGITLASALNALLGAGGFLFLAAVAERLRSGSETRWAVVWVAVAAGISLAGQAGSGLAAYALKFPHPWYAVLPLSPLASVAMLLWWLRAWRTPGWPKARAALWSLWGAFALGFAASAAAILSHESTLGELDVAVSGILRVAGVGLLAWAFFRGGLLDAAPEGRQAPGRRPRRMAPILVAGGLIAGFALCQVLQVVFPDQTWILGVGAVAAVVVGVPGGPLERTLRHQRERGERGEDIFRDAVRLALRDGRIEPDEERQLVIMAGKLGLAPQRAYQIRDDETAALGPRRKRAPRRA